MSDPEIIHHYERRSMLAAALLATLRGLLQAVLFLIPFFCALVILDRFTDLASGFRKIMWFVGVSGAMGFFVHGFWPFSLFGIKARSRAVARRSSLRSDDLEIAHDFLRRPTEGVSEELKVDYLARIAQALSKVSITAAFPPYPWKSRGLVCAAFVFVLPVLPSPGRVMFPFVSSAMRHSIDIKPGNAEVSFGATARVEVYMKTTSVEKPKLFVKGADNWVDVGADVESARLFAYDLQNIVEPLSYRVFWRGEWSERFTLTPVKALSVEGFAITLTPPGYLGAAAVTQTSPEISGVAGSSVLMRVRLSRPAAATDLLLPEGERVAMSPVGDNELEARFVLTHAGSYGFAFSADRYPIQIRPDEAPVVTLLSPAEDLIVSLKDKLPVTYEATDDLGLGQINLIFEKERGKPETRRVQTFSDAVPNTLSTYDWDLSADGFKPGDVFRFQVEAVDRNTVTGPGRAKSEWRMIEIASFEKSHEALADILEAWREKTLDLLGDINTSRASLDKENVDFTQLKDSVDKSAQQSTQIESALEKIVSLMEKDPLGDYGVWLEHKEMHENLSLMNQTLMREAQGAVQTGNKKEAARSLDEISSELERMLALSEDMSKKQRASDVMDMADNLQKIGEDLVKQLERNPAEEAVNRLLQEADSIMRQMAKTIQKTPQELPDDFVNQQALKNLEMDKTQDILSQIQDALKRGDTQKAMQLAKQYLDAVKKMSEQLSQAYDAYTEENSAESLADEVEKRAEKLNEITKKQQELLAETQKHESERLKQLMSQQEKLLEKLYKEQMEAIATSQGIIANEQFHAQVRLSASSNAPSMKTVADELLAKKVQRSVQLLEHVVAEFTAIENAFAASSTSAAGMVDLRNVRSREAKILEELQHPNLPSAPMSASERESFSGLKSGQSSLGKDTQSLRKEFQALSRKSASLNMGLSQPLSKAANAMEKAAEHLADVDSKNAQASQEEALRALSEAGEALAGAQEMMSGMPGGGRPKPGDGMGGGGPRAMVRPSNSTGGRGSHVGKVRLPSAKDYKPSKAFREELLESLKEKYPKAYEEIIHKYYKRLTD